jgi:hypothetical protein
VRGRVDGLAEDEPVTSFAPEHLADRSQRSELLDVANA